MRLSAGELDRVTALIEAGQVDVTAAGAGAGAQPPRALSCRQLVDRRRAAVMPPHG